MSYYLRHIEMATLPENVGFATEIEYVSQPSLTWLINRQMMRVQTQTDGLEAVRQAVEIYLNTERFRWQIYTARIGTELDTLIGEDSELVESEIPRMVTDALMIDDRVLAVEDFVLDVNGDVMTVKFIVVTVYGSITEEITI